MGEAPQLPVHTLPQELQALLFYLSPREQGHRWQETQSDLEWDRLMELAIHHRVYPLLQHRFRQQRPASFPPALEQALGRLCSENTFRMMHLTAEMLEAASLFERYGIRTLMLKGPVLAQALYGELSLRTSKDLDLLVPPDQVEAAEALLRSRGYRLDDDAPRIINDLKWKTHHVSYTNVHTGVQIELHWNLNPDTRGEPDFDELWSRRSEASFSGRTVYFPGREDLFIYLVAHGARHGWFRLRWLMDIDRMLQLPLQWDLLYRLLERNECRRLAGQAAILCEKLLHTPIPAPLRPFMLQRPSVRLARQAFEIIRDLVRLAPRTSSHDVNRHYRGYVLGTMSLRQKAVYALGKLYPSSWDAQLLPLPRKLHFMYFLLRPFLWYWRRRRTGRPNMEG